jgi:hypothetical protein
MPLDVAIERVYKAVSKYAASYRSDQNKLLTGMVVTGVLGLPVFFPFGVPSLLVAGAMGASAVSWQELGTMRDRLKPEYLCLKNSILLEQFIKWLAEEVKKRRGQDLDSPTAFPADVITTANILAAYEHTVFSVAQGEHLENNASDPILALFVAKLRQSTNQLPSWVMEAFRHLEQAEAQRSAHLDAAYGYMFGNLSAHHVGQNTRLNAVDVPTQSVEGEQRLGKPQIEISHPQLLPSYSPALSAHSEVAPTSSKLEPTDIALKMAEVPKSTIIAASPRVGKGVVVSQAIAYLRQLHPDLEIWLIDPKDEPTERHYWSLIDPDKRCHFDLRDFDVDVETAVEVFSEHLTRFNRSNAPRKLLIIDEFVTLNQKCAGPFMNQLKDFVVGICSSGEVNPDLGIGRFVWAMTQSPYVTDLGFKTKAALSTFQRVFLLNKASVHLYALAVSASFVPAGFDQKLNRLLEPTGRVFYYSRSDSWHPIPNYQLQNQSRESSLREKLEGLLPGTSQLPGSHPEAVGSSGSSSPAPEAPEGPREEGLPDSGEWRKYFPEAPEVVEEALFGAYQKALEVEGGKKKFISEILKAGTGGRKYQAASAYVDYLTKKFGNKP